MTAHMIPSPYDEELREAATRSVGVSKAGRDAIEGLLLKREGYLRAMQDMAPFREGYQTLIAAVQLAWRYLYNFRHDDPVQAGYDRLVPSEIRAALMKALSQAEALEKGGAP